MGDRSHIRHFPELSACTLCCCVGCWRLWFGHWAVCQPDIHSHFFPSICTIQYMHVWLVQSGQIHIYKHTHTRINAHGIDTKLNTERHRTSRMYFVYSHVQFPICVCALHMTRKNRVRVFISVAVDPIHVRTHTHTLRKTNNAQCGRRMRMVA